MLAAETNEDAMALALHALAWVLADDQRARRLLDLTGLSPDHLRAAAAQPETLDAVLGFLEGHEPDLVACAEALNVAPQALVAARGSLN